MKSLSRAPYILAMVSDLAGCGFHRMLRPMEVIVRSGLANGRAEMSMIPEHILKIMAPDVVVIQRWYEKHQIEYLKLLRATLPQAHIVYEIDDAMSEVPEASWHRPFMPSDINAKIAATVALCDSMSVTTRPLAEHMRSFCPGIDVRVVPNMMCQSDFEMAGSVRQQPKRRTTEEVRIGWGGGISHDGDLAILQHAVANLTGVRWVFLGMAPKMPEGAIFEVHPGVQPQHYLQTLAMLDLDLMVAPLEDNAFNRSKSNLRLIEGGACRYPVIASPVDPYVFDAPPVWGYAKTPEEWTDAIGRFIAATPATRQKAAQRMLDWTTQKYSMETRAAERVEGWLPSNVKAFRPTRRQNYGQTVIVGEGASVATGKMAVVFGTLDEAIEKGTGDILYVRPGTDIPETIVDRLVAESGGNLATISVLTNDATPQAFPKRNSFFPIDAVGGSRIAKLADELEGMIRPELPIAAGPAILLRRAALDIFGPPEVMSPGSLGTEFAIVEWSAMAAARGWRNTMEPSIYAVTSNPLQLGDPSVQGLTLRIGYRWPPRSLDEAPFNKIREDLEISHNRVYYTAAPVDNQGDFQAWAARYDSFSKRDIADMHAWHQEASDQSKGKPALVWSATLDDTAFEAAIHNQSVDWILHMAPTADLAPHAIIMLEQAIRDNPGAVIFYADHDHTLPDGRRLGPDFKPNFDHHMLLGRDYVSPICAIKRSAAVISGTDFTMRSEESILAYATVLNLLAINAQIVHVPRILAHLTMDLSISGTRAGNAKKAEIAQKHADLIGWSVKVSPLQQINALREVSYISATTPKVGIIIPTVNNVGMLEPCLATLLSKTDYPNFQVLVMQNGDMTAEMEDFLNTVSDPRVDIIRMGIIDFNWSKINNIGARTMFSEGCEVICFLNDDTRVLDPAWLSEMVGASQVPGVGAVGAKLRYPNDTVQHIGVIASRGATGHMHKGLPILNPGAGGITIISHEATAVTGACMVVSKSVYQDLGGLDEAFAHNFNDVAFCLEVRRHGLVNVVAGKSALQHFEGVTRTSPGTVEGRNIQAAEGIELGRRYPEEDPYWNPNLAFYLFKDQRLIAGTNCDVFQWPPAPFPWRDTDRVAERVLLIGPPMGIDDEIHDGAHIFEMSIFSPMGKIMKPPMENVRPFDVRDAEEARGRIERLGINRVVVTSLGDQSPAMLIFLTKLGLPVQYRPFNAEMICPRGDLKPDGVSLCAQGWKNIGTCQSCIDQNGSRHGYVNMLPWYMDWMRFTDQPGVSVDLIYLRAAEFQPAIADVMATLEGTAGDRQAAE